MIFYALTSAGLRGRCWNPSLKGEGFNTSRGARQMLMYQKCMFDRYYCIKTFSRSKTSGKKNASKKYFFRVPIRARKGTLPTYILTTPIPGQILTSCYCARLMMTSVFVMAPECLYVKPQSRALTACELPF